MMGRSSPPLPPHDDDPAYFFDQLDGVRPTEVIIEQPPVVNNANPPPSEQSVDLNMSNIG